MNRKWLRILRIASIVFLAAAAFAEGGWLRWRLIENLGVRNKAELGLDGYEYYVSAAEGLLAGRGLDPAYNHRTPPPPLYVPPPLQSVFVAGVFALAGNQDMINVYRAQAALGLAAGVFVFLILLDWAGVLAALIGLWIWMLYPEFIYWARLPMTENNYFFMMLLTLWALTRWASRRSAAWAVAGALLIGLTTLQRATALFLGPVMALAALAWVGGRGRRRWAQAAIFLLLPHLVLAPWMIRNKLRTGDPVWVNSNGGILLYAVNNLKHDPLHYPEYMKQPDWAVPEVEQRFWGPEFEKHRTYYAYSRLYQAEARKYVLAHPLHFLKNMAIKLYQRFVLMPDIDNTIGMAYMGFSPRFFSLVFDFLLFAGLAGLCARREDWRQPTRRVLALCFAYYAAFIALMLWDSDGRMPLPLRVFLMLFAAEGLARLLRQAFGRSPAEFQAESPQNPVI